MDPSLHLAPALFDLGSGAHWIIILVVALLLFGRRLPEIMRSLGGSIREFKKGMDTDQVADQLQPPVDGAVSRHAVPPPAPLAPPPAPAPGQPQEAPVQDPAKPH